MKIKDLPVGTGITSFKVKLPDSIYKASSLPMYALKNIPVYLFGWTNGDFFVKTDLNSSQIYPMFWGAMPDIIDWEVVDYKQ